MTGSNVKIVKIEEMTEKRTSEILGDEMGFWEMKRMTRNS